MRYCLTLIMLTGVISVASATRADEPKPVHWIWHTRERAADQRVPLRREFQLDALPTQAELIILVDYAAANISINDSLVARCEPYDNVLTIDVTNQLKLGDNLIRIDANSVAGPTAAMARLTLHYADRVETIVTDSSWQFGVLDPLGRGIPQTPRVEWRTTFSFGEVESHRYGLDQPAITISPLDDYTQWKRAINANQGTDPRTFEVAPGFKVDLVHSAAADEDSWVSLAIDPKGRWIIGQEKQGLLRLTIADDGKPASVERINKTLRECRGLQFKGDSLYALANNDKALYGLRDTTGDDQFDSIEKLFTFEGDVGHGRNQLTLGADGKLYGIFGDSIFEPKSFRSLIPTLANPTDIDKARNGFVVRFDDQIENSTVLTRGLRNPYGIAINQHGDMFTYDADAEYDMGSSWYRPTRVLHLQPGGDYRWRRVTQQWPPYFPDQADMPPATLDIGKGSPTAVAFGSGKQFPPRYADSLFILDWAYGRIVAVHLTPQGASYHAQPETFLRGQPLNVTDVEFGPDGAMYFTTGGRQTQSALYRVRYVGEPAESAEPTPQQLARETHAKEARRIRMQLHEWAAKPNVEHLAKIWQHMASADPSIRHAARTALEHLPVAAWRGKLPTPYTDRNAWSLLKAKLRVDSNPQLGKLVEHVTARKSMPDQYAVNSQSPSWQLREALFLAEGLLVSELLSDDENDAIHTWLNNVFPTLHPQLDWPINRRLSTLLSEQPDAAFVTKSMNLLREAASQKQRLHYMFVLRHAKTGWTAELREEYFDHLRQLDDFVGGQGMPTFRRLIREEAIASLPEAERSKYEAMLKQAEPSWVAEIPSEEREFVQKWFAEDFKDDELTTAEADPANGRTIFLEANCIRCHRFEGRGEVSGPDLTAVARRFSPRDLLVSVLHPSKVVSEKYASSTFELADGRVVSGTIAPGDYRSPELVVVPNLLQPQTTVKVAKAEIVAQGRAKQSPMPEGLLDYFERHEILDLIAYLTRSRTDIPVRQ